MRVQRAGGGMTYAASHVASVDLATLDATSDADLYSTGRFRHGCEHISQVPAQRTCVDLPALDKDGGIVAWNREKVRREGGGITYGAAHVDSVDALAPHSERFSFCSALNSRGDNVTSNVLCDSIGRSCREWSFDDSDCQDSEEEAIRFVLLAGPGSGVILQDHQAVSDKVRFTMGTGHTTASCGSTTYLPEFFCCESDDRIFRRLIADLRTVSAVAGERAATPGQRAATRTYSMACTPNADHEFANWEIASDEFADQHYVEHASPEFSNVFTAVGQRIAEHFDIDVTFATILLYRSGSDWQDFRQDPQQDLVGCPPRRCDGPDTLSERLSGSRPTRSTLRREDFTVRVSFGAPREFRFLNEESGETFALPERNGGVFAFDEGVNWRFKHGVPRSEGNAGPRISAVFKGRRRALNERNSSRSPAGVGTSAVLVGR